jgi:DNA mismatch endonuclease (patch repair protein)
METMRTADTGPELALRRELHRRGLRFRLHRKLEFDRRRSIDIVFPTEKVAVFVDGCFWHYCPEHAVLPKNNAEFWRVKLEGNRERDVATTGALEADGWSVVRVWEHADVVTEAQSIEALVRRNRAVLA